MRRRLTFGSNKYGSHTKPSHGHMVDPLVKKDQVLYLFHLLIMKIKTIYTTT
ncbi:hypothetical protein K450DRAFT_228495 [Umbelopsis ramanniana AG]|uniref:Uncharacterized protein n=1 Tax=Umbelopsis ramanniana AG TaxID=1314678 RepID=A0AAD5HH68_UMBRA|nr:uncharacterized protein K450DRAFT_228495 [Umbelopsis ramanniana AG]KAI8582331.1 hypothetical protein K450DRAFT_228495 [Umbelopsis ramanniana AG]